MSLQPKHLQRYKDVARLVLKYRSAELHSGPEAPVSDPPAGAQRSEDVDPKAA